MKAFAPLIGVSLLMPSMGGCGRAPEAGGSVDGVWALDPVRSSYGVNAERRITETFRCATRARPASLRCEIEGVRANGDTSRALFVADGAPLEGSVSGIPGVNRVRLTPTARGYDAVFLLDSSAVLGYELRVFGDSLVVRTVDAVTRTPLDSRIVYVRSRSTP